MLYTPFLTSKANKSIISVTVRYLFLAILFSLAACSGGGGGGSDATAPSEEITISSIFTDVINVHPSATEKTGFGGSSTIRFTVSAEVDHSEGVGSITRVFFNNALLNRFWDVLGGGDGIPLSQCYIVVQKTFECSFYSGISPDNIALTGWNFVVEDRLGNVVMQPFELSLEGGGSPNANQFMYSEQFTGSTFGGVAAMEAMTVVDNSLSFTSSPGTQSFRIEFTTTDARAERYDISFFGDRSEISGVGFASPFSPSIQSTPIVQGQTVVLDIPWSEIAFEDGLSESDVGGIHIRLFSDPVNRQGELFSEEWAHLVSISEFIPL